MFQSKLPRFLKITVFAVLCAAVFLGVFQTVIMLTSYEFEVMLYYRDAILPTVMNVLLALITVGSGAAVLITSYKKELPGQLSKISTPASFFGGVAAILIFAVFAFELYDYAVMGGGIVYAHNTQSSSAFQQLFYLARVIFALPAGVYMLTLALGRKPSRNVSMLLGFFMVMWLAMNLITNYFDMTGPLNSPPRLLRLISISAMMLTMLYSLRYSIDRPKTRTFIWLSLVSAVFGAVSSFPMLVLTAIGRYGVSGETVGYAAHLALTFYIAFRVSEFLSLDVPVSDITVSGERTSAEAGEASDKSEDNPKSASDGTADSGKES